MEKEGQGTRTKRGPGQRATAELRVKDDGTWAKVEMDCVGALRPTPEEGLVGLGARGNVGVRNGKSTMSPRAPAQAPRGLVACS